VSRRPGGPVPVCAVIAALAVALATGALAQGTETAPAIEHAIIGEQGERTAEISTADMGQILARNSAAVIDARPYAEYAISHIPGAINVGAKPGLARSMYVSDVAEITRRLGGRRDTAIVLYCNGPYCGKSSRLAEDLLNAGYTNVRRYQLGIPVWRALGGVTQIEDDGLRRVFTLDQTAVWVDARDSLRFAARTLPRARNIPRVRVTGIKDTGEVRHAKDDGRLPMDDHDTRIIVFADDPRDAYYVAQQLTREAFHNVSFYNGTVVQALIAIGR
jgi:rhodanese-related sulfurtransferase